MIVSSSNIASLLHARAAESPDHVAYVFLSGEDLRQSSLTYAELDSQARSIAACLNGAKARGERALLLYPPGLEFISAFFGCLYAGVIAVPAYPPRLNRNALRILSMAHNSGAKLALTTQEVASRLPAITAHTPEMGTLQWVATDIPGAASTRGNGLRISDAEAIAYLQYTSGSTSEPKGVMVSHANVLENSRYLATAFCHSADDISLSWLPHFHDLGLVHGIVQPLYSGFPGYLMAPMSFLQRPLDWLKAISEFRITHSDGPNFAYELCVNKISEQEKQTLDLSTWRMALTGAEPVFPETIDRFAQAFARCGFSRTAFYPAYGLAEATLVVSGGKSEPELTRCSVVSSALEQNKVIFANGSGSGERTLVGSGTFASPMEIEIVDPESKRKCPPETVGEIWVAGPSVALGYWNLPQETKDIFNAKLDSDSRHFLRTGDLGFIHLGNIFVTGRHKELIIIRGRNYYPQDIERTAREACPEVALGTGAAFSIPVETEERAVLVQELPRRRKLDLSQLLMRIRQAIAEEHELQLEEIVLVKAGSVPRTSSGKIQRGLCRNQFRDGALQVVGRWQAEPMPDEAPNSVPIRDFDDMQIWFLARIAARVGVPAEEIATDRPLLHFGLDSLIAVDLAHDVQRKFGLLWQPSVFLETDSVTALALRAAQELHDQQPQHTPAPHIREAGEAPLSFGQLGLWFLHQLSPASVAYNVALSIRITSDVDLPALRRSFQVLLDRHGALRTTFASIDNLPVQKVHSNSDICFNFDNAQSWTEAEIRQRVASEIHTPFDLERGPLFRVRVFSRSAHEHLLLVTAHHIVLDLWSLAQLMEEFGVLYPAERLGATAQLPLPSGNYSQFVRWQKEMLAGERGEKLWSYWSRQLGGELPALELATDFVRPRTQTYSGACSRFAINAELADSLKKLSQDSGVTLYMTLLAAFEVLLHRYSGQEEILVGSPTAGRARSEFASTVGYFVNPVVLRNRISVASSFGDFLRRDVRKSVLEALEHQDYPFALLTERLQPVRDPGRSPVFQVMFAMQKARSLHEQALSLFSLGETTARLNLGGLEMQSFALEQRIAQFDLSLVMAETHDGLAAIFEYNTDLFCPATISRMAACFQQLLQSIGEDPAGQISRLRLLSAEEAKQIIHASQAPPAISSQHVPVYQLFEQQAARTPHATALIFNAEKVSYRELNELANRLAHHLIHSGVRQAAPVAVCLERSPEMVTSLLAVFKAGAVYVPLDPEYPQERLSFLLRDSGTEVVITRQGLIATGVERTQRIVCLDAEREAIARESTANPQSARNSDFPAYVIYTSGSTGSPKGVLASHSSLSNHMQWLARECPLHETDRVLQKYSPSFDASLAEIFHPLITGAALVIARAGGQHDHRYLVDLILKHRVTEIDSVPTMLKALFEDERICTSGALRRVISGGEALSTELQHYICKRLGRVELINMYGPTEATITASFHRCISTRNEARVAVGIPVTNTQVYLLDSDLQPVPVGALGEIYIGGSGLAFGYLNQPHLTAERFVPDPFSVIPGARLYRTGDLGRYREPGLLEYAGRLDRQVKVRGFRIELMEIEQELKRHSSIQDAVVVTRVRSSGEEYLAAYVQAVPGESITSSQIRSWLQTIMPRHMIPAAIMPLDRLPRLVSGKPDTRSLPEPGRTEPHEEFAPPRDQAEQVMVDAWERALGRRTIGIRDNFFELGGDSILCLQVVAYAREKGLEVTPNQMFQFQTIADLAPQVKRKSPTFEVQEPTRQFFPLTPIQHWFFEQDLNQLNHYSQSLLLELSAPLDVILLERAVQELILHHDALRLRFQSGEGGWRQKIAEADSNTVVKCIGLAHLRSQEHLKEIDRIAEELRATLNVTEGPIIRAAYFDLGTNNAHQLFITVHHLAIDGVSWQILLRDLQQIYEQLTDVKEPALYSKPLGLQQWSELLQSHAQSEALRQELNWWTAHLSSSAATIPIDYDGNNTAASSCALCVSLPQDETRQLLHEVPRTYRTEINDVLLTALAQTLTRWTKQSSVLVDLEGHGREGIIEGADPSGTVGWFTTVFPALLETNCDLAPEKRLNSVKEHLRRIPARGIGFGLLRYLSGDAATRQKLKSLPQADVSFNYLGQLDRICPGDSLFRMLRIDGPMKTSFRRRSHVLEIDCYIKDSCLQMQWTYSSELHQQSTIQRLASDFLEELRLLIQHCSSRQEAEYTPSDFPLIELNQSQLKRIQQLYGPIADIHPLSPMQQGMLFHSLYEPHRGTYLTQLVCEVAGDLDLESFRTAWQHAMDNHSAFRSGFESEIVTEEPVQVVKQAAQPEWSLGDWSYATAQERSKLLESYLQSDRERPMDLRHAPLMRFALFAAGSRKHVFIWSSHHLLMDGWSLPIVLQEVFGGYEALRRREKLASQPEPLYREYIKWLKTQNLSAAEKFWRKKMQGFTSTGTLQKLHRTGLPAAINDQAFCEYEIRLSEPETARLKEFSRRQRLTLSTVTYGLWALILSRIDARKDVVFGIVVSGRHVPLPRVDEMVGVFINTLPLRVNVESASRLSDWLRELQERRSEAAQFEYTPLSLVQAWSELPRGAALFDSIVVFENYPAVGWDSVSSDLRIENIRSFERSNYPLTLWILPGRQLSLKVGYDSGLLDGEKVAALLRGYSALLSAISDEIVSELGRNGLAQIGPLWIASKNGPVLQPATNGMQSAPLEPHGQEPGASLAAVGTVATTEQQPGTRDGREGEKFE